MSQSIRLLEALAAAALGFLVTWALDAANGWWLNSGSGVWRTGLVLSGLGLFATAWRVGTPLARAAGVWAGAFVCMVVLLFRAGPGTIWPIVIIFAGAISGGAVLAGALVGSLVARRRGNGGVSRANRHSSP